MPLPAPAARSPLHTRRIEANGFHRADGLWEVEARITDTKSYAFDNAWRGRVEPGNPVHDMWLRIAVDDQLIIREVAACTDSSPFEICPAITGNFQRLVGLQIGKGWMRQVRERLGGTQGCTHLVELLGPMATVVFQTIFPARERLGRIAGGEGATAAPVTKRPSIIDTCHALASDGQAVKQNWPEFYTGNT